VFSRRRLYRGQCRAQDSHRSNPGSAIEKHDDRQRWSPRGQSANAVASMTLVVTLKSPVNGSDGRTVWRDGSFLGFGAVGRHRHWWPSGTGLRTDFRAAPPAHGRGIGGEERIGRFRRRAARSRPSARYLCAAPREKQLRRSAGMERTPTRFPRGATLAARSPPRAPGKFHYGGEHAHGIAGRAGRTPREDTSHATDDVSAARPRRPIFRCLTGRAAIRSPGQSGR